MIKKTEEEKLGLCVRCKKNKATLQYTESYLNYSHGFIENICEKCYNKIRDENAWYQQGIKKGKTIFADEVLKMLNDGDLWQLFGYISCLGEHPTLQEQAKRLEKKIIKMQEEISKLIKDSQQPLKNSKEFNTSYEGERGLSKSALTNGEMESSPASDKHNPADNTPNKIGCGKDLGYKHECGSNAYCGEEVYRGEEYGLGYIYCKKCKKKTKPIQEKK